MIVPFFGDQPFWGAMVAKAGAGAEEPIPYKHLNAESLAEGIKQCLTFEAKANAAKLARDIELEGDGAKNAVASFHRHLPLQGKNSMRCSIMQERVAVWELKKAHLLQLSPLAAALLVEKKKLRWNELRLVRHKEWNDFEGPGEPLTGGGAALLNSAGGIVRGVGGTPVRWAKRLRKREKKQEQRRASATPKTSTEARRSTSSRPSRKAPQPVFPKKVPQDGEHGMEKHLPDGPSLHEAALEKSVTRNENGVPVGPIASSQQLQEENGTDNDNISSGSEDNLAQDMAVDAGMGLAKSGEALAR
ncbi:MAG: hypothetical protein Q9224_007733, partial [Gallowayella concinna]